MKKTHILETDLKTINGQTVLGSGNIEITTETDLTDYYNKTQVDGFINEINAELTTLTDKVEAKEVEADKVLVSNGDSTSEWKDYNPYSYTESNIAPVNPKLGDDWRDTVNGKLYKWSSVGGVAEWSEIGAGSSSGVFNPDNDIMLSAGKGVVMTSGNGTIYKLYIDNDGRLTTEVI